MPRSCRGLMRTHPGIRRTLNIVRRELRRRGLMQTQPRIRCNLNIGRRVLRRRFWNGAPADAKYSRAAAAEVPALTAVQELAVRWATKAAQAQPLGHFAREAREDYPGAA
jgi:hypothetical protein